MSMERIIERILVQTGIWLWCHAEDDEIELRSPRYCTPYRWKILDSKLPDGMRRFDAYRFMYYAASLLA